jgi:hypothetical protein
MGFSDASDPEGVSQKRACFTPGAGEEKIHPIVPGTRLLHAGCRDREDSPDRARNALASRRVQGQRRFTRACQERACFMPGAGAVKIQPIVPGRACFTPGAGEEKIQPIVPGTRLLHAGCRGSEDSADRARTRVLHAGCRDREDSPDRARNALASRRVQGQRRFTRSCQKRACFTPGAGAEKIHPIVPGTRLLHAGCRDREDSPDRARNALASRRVQGQRRFTRS